MLDAIVAVRREVIGRNLPHGSRVALLLRNSPHYVSWYYGVLAAGTVVVPLNPQERAAVLARQTGHSGAKLLVGDPEHPEWPALCAALAHLPVSILELPLIDGGAGPFRYGCAPEPAEKDSVAQEHESHDLATIMYTSGTTGSPKGVMLSSENLHSNAVAIIDYLSLAPTDHGLCVLPLQFSYGNSMLHSHLLCGAQLTLEENFAYPRMVLQRMHEKGITGFAGVPSTFALLLRHELQEFDLRRLRYVTQAGGAMAKAMIRRLRERMPNTKIYIMYGQTEATARVSYLPPQRLDEKLGSVGVPIAGVEIDVRQHGLSAGAWGSGRDLDSWPERHAWLLGKCNCNG